MNRWSPSKSIGANISSPSFFVFQFPNPFEYIATLAVHTRINSTQIHVAGSANDDSLVLLVNEHLTQGVEPRLLSERFQDRLL